jgi:MSHA biogenesis protein MshM
MYQEFFGLREAPFSLTPDTSFYYDNPAHQEALNTLLVALQLGEGFLKLTGEVGTGKTLLCRKLLRELADAKAFVTAYIPNPALTPVALRHALADELGIQYRHNIGQHRVMQMIGNRLVEEKSAGRKVVLIIDEAQALPTDCLEAIRLLTNLETEKSKLLQVVLFGQPELDDHLSRPATRQLLQRIMFSYRLAPMNSRMVSHYLGHRLAVAGHVGEPLFVEPIARRIARESNGIPRLVNILAHKSLLMAFGEGKPMVEMRHVKKAVADTESLYSRRRRSGIRRLAMALAGVLSAGVAAFGALVMAGTAG